MRTRQTRRPQTPSSQSGATGAGQTTIRPRPRSRARPDLLPPLPSAPCCIFSYERRLQKALSALNHTTQPPSLQFIIPTIPRNGENKKPAKKIMPAHHPYDTLTLPSPFLGRGTAE